MAARVLFQPGPQEVLEDGDPEVQEAQEEVFEEMNNAVRTRERTIASLRDLAKTADYISRKQGKENTRASGFGVLGGVLTFGAGAVTLATGGAAAPLLVGSLATAGTVSGLGGGAWNIWNAKNRVTEEENLKAHAREVLKRDAVAMARLNNVLQRVLNGCMGNPNQIFRELHMVGQSMITISIVYGAQNAVNLLMLCMPGIALYSAKATTIVLSGATFLLNNLLKEVAEEVTKEVAEEIAIKAANQAAKNVTAGFARKFARDAAKEAAEKVAKVTLKETTKKIMEEGSKEVVEEVTKQAAKKAAKKAAQKVAKRAARKAAEKAVKETMQTAAKVTGGITAGFGGLTVVWEGWNLMSAYKQSTENESAAGRELRTLADDMANRLYMGQHGA